MPLRDGAGACVTMGGHEGIIGGFAAATRPHRRRPQSVREWHTAPKAAFYPIAIGGRADIFQLPGNDVRDR